MKKNKNLKEKREALLKCKEILQPFGEYLIVTEGASITRTKGPGIIKDMRNLLKNYELKHGENPKHDWSEEAK